MTTEPRDVAAPSTHPAPGTAQPSPPADVPADDGAPSLRQVLHAATGDRAAEAKALVDSTDDDIAVEDALVAVRQAHGDISAGAQQPATASDIATPEHAAAVAAERENNE